MPSTIMFNSTGLPGGSAKVTRNHGTDIIINPPNEASLHFTFHANRATHVSSLVTICYNGSAWYHVAVRDGVYYARIYQNKQWQDYPAQTIGGWEYEKKKAKEYSLDIEQILAVS